MKNLEVDTSQELEQMRQDYAALKQQFDKQQIISGALMEKAFQADARWLSFDQANTWVTGAVAIPATVIACLANDIPLGFMAAFVLYIVLGLGGNLLLHRNLSKEKLFEEDILTASRKVKRFKQQYKWLEIGTWAVMLILLGSFMVAMGMIQNYPETALLMLMIISIGITMKYTYVKRLLRACDDMLDRLTLKEEDKTNEYE